jgi:hypothetical protein
MGWKNLELGGYLPRRWGYPPFSDRLRVSRRWAAPAGADHVTTATTLVESIDDASAYVLQHEALALATQAARADHAAGGERTFSATVRLRDLVWVVASDVHAFHGKEDRAGRRYVRALV